jgi:hypothetical protein
MLKAAGYTNVYNGGSWTELRGKLNAVWFIVSNFRNAYF